MHDLNITIVNKRNPSKEVQTQTVSHRRVKRIAISENNTCMSIKFNDCASEKCHYQVKIVNNRRCLVILKNDNGFEIIMAK